MLKKLEDYVGGGKKSVYNIQLLRWLSIWRPDQRPNKSTTGKWNSAVLSWKSESDPLWFVFHFAFCLQVSCRYSWARLDLPREGHASAVHQSTCLKALVQDLLGLLAKRWIIPRAEHPEGVTTSLSLVLALLVNTSHLWRSLINFRQDFLVDSKQLQLLPSERCFLGFGSLAAQMAALVLRCFSSVFRALVRNVNKKTVGCLPSFLVLLPVIQNGHARAKTFTCWK